MLSKEAKEVKFNKWKTTIIQRYGSMEAYLAKAKAWGQQSRVTGFTDRELASRAGKLGGSTPRIKEDK